MSDVAAGPRRCPVATGRTRQTFAAVALALLLGIAWTVGDWPNLSALNLPDTDDAMRLQQVRDWIAGQPFADVSQHRLADGLAMHWSRIGDLVPAAIVILLRPLAGVPLAETTAVVVWPIAQFAALLVLTASIARVVAPKAVFTAIVLAALAYPATSLFLPGRIDHHALQLLLVLVQVRALLARPGRRAGAVAGCAAAVGAAIGLETAPFAALTGGIVVVAWLRGDAGDRSSAFGLTLAASLVVLAPLSGHGGTCDTVAPLLPAGVAAGLALSALGRIERHRWQWLGAVAFSLTVIAWPAARPCFAGPYAAVDPLVRRMWLTHVAEAQPLFAAPLSSMLAYGGLLTAGLVASAWLARRRGGAWYLLLCYQAMSAAITIAQLRGAYVGAALAVLPIAALLAHARARAALPAVLALWTVGTGLCWSLLATLGVPDAPAAARGCTRAGVIARLATLPPGRVLAGIDLGSYILAGTHHRVVAAPYHRNDAGNRDLYRFFLGSPATAGRVARTWDVDYVVICPGDFAALAPSRASVAGRARPAWLHRLTPRDAVPAIFARYPRLSPSPPAR